MAAHLECTLLRNHGMSTRWLLFSIFFALACSRAGPPPDETEEASLQPEGWDAELKMAEAPDNDPAQTVVAVNLEARPTQLELRPGVQTEVWTYNGTLPGPLIRAKVGDRLKVHFVNHLPEPTTIHWHGLRVPAAMDGSEAMQAPVPPGGTFDYEFTLLDAGTYWYHPHVRSSAQVGAGLYGALIVEDPAEPKLGDELVLMLSDVSLEDDGTLSPANQNGWFGDYFGREGNLVLLNGKPPRTLRARVGAPQRWRIINAARTRFHKLKLPGQSWRRVAGDGGLIPQAQAVDTVTLTPGERVELYVLPQPQPGGPVAFQSLDADRFHINALQPPVDLMTFSVTDLPPPEKEAPPLPSPLRDIPATDVTGARVELVKLTEQSAPGGAVMGINGKTHHESDPLHAKVGERVIWEIDNTTSYDHPFHLHGFFFQVIDVNGKPPALREWKDTVNVGAKQKARLAIEFDNRPGMWMFHCHILDHAELGMMGMLMVMP